ncbi:MAG: hypothetical protein Q9224_002277 [Gallowayella concinna]
MTHISLSDAIIHSEKALLTDEALASTIIPVHSDASTITSVTTSPMDFQDALDPPVDLKIPLPDPGSLSRTCMAEANVADVAGAPSLETGTGLNGRDVLKDPSMETSVQEQRDGFHTQGDDPASEEPTLEEPRSQRPERGDLKTSDIPRHIPLSDVRYLVELEQYHRNRTLSLQRTLESLTRTYGLNGRLIPVLSSAHRAMTDCYQSGDPTGFARIYQICETLAEPSAHPPLQTAVEDQVDLMDPGRIRPLSWLERLPHGCQDVVLSFLTCLRTDNTFFADRLSALSSTEFTGLFGHSHAPRKAQSIFQVHSPRTVLGYSRNSQPDESAPMLAKLRSFHQGDPFFVLFHGIFDDACKPGTREHFLRNLIWSTACARVISEEKVGSDEFTTNTLDAFSSSSNWNMKPQLETYVMRVLQDGAFLVDPTSKEPTDFKEPLEIRNANAVIATSKFFDQAIKDLLVLLLRSSPVNMLPDGLLNFICCTLGMVHNVEIRNRARNFIVSKWFISSFLCRLLTNPEVNTRPSLNDSPSSQDD